MGSELSWFLLALPALLAALLILRGFPPDRPPKPRNAKQERKQHSKVG